MWLRETTWTCSVCRTCTQSKDVPRCEWSPTRTGAVRGEDVRLMSQSSYSWWMDSRYSWWTHRHPIHQMLIYSLKTQVDWQETVCLRPHQWNDFLLLSASLVQPLMADLRRRLQVDWSQRKRSQNGYQQAVAVSNTTVKQICVLKNWFDDEDLFCAICVDDDLLIFSAKRLL